ncbi:L-threonylcarbamoyladenylate synthase [Methylotetracoccus oryzae]|uniref:L-threonylcarbamoyladenylate synthase n=1 Tax=Methylotetracoccus oryzae TaxID=1919059 RepID=UPI00111A8B5C|nr:L-threonylcarbamoyladenylate synthase [Methylotetracoccus oryzae]
MPTELIHVDPQHPAVEGIVRAAGIIKAGGLVAFPTETVYGLGANALDATAVARIFEAKQRPLTDPLIVHLAQVAQVHEVAANIPDIVHRLAARFWPGPLTLILHRAAKVPASVSAGRDTVAVRVPAHAVAHALLVDCGLPIAAPSANLFSRPSPTTAQHVLEDLDGRVDLVLDGGSTTIGLESTVIDLTAASPILLRPGGLPPEALREILPELRIPEAPRISADDEHAASPGTLLKHYSPRAALLLLRGEADAAQRLASDIVEQTRQRGRTIGLLIPAEEAGLYGGLSAAFASLGESDDLPAVARVLFTRLRDLDKRKVDLILAREPAGGGLGLAIRDRLFRAAEGRIIDAGASLDVAKLLEAVLPAD